MMFFKREINPIQVSDKIRFRNIDRVFDAVVRSDASSLVIGLKHVNDRLSNMTDETPEAERLSAARFFADTLFGKDQGGAFCEFYNNDPLTIINACGMYFRERLGKKITKAQKK
jgi:hypothetical protein